MSIHTARNHRSRLQSPHFGTGATRREGQLEALDQLIASGKTILYKNEDFKNDKVVANFVHDHRPLRTAMLGAIISLYVDPCGCCIPSYGPRDFQFKIKDPTAAIKYLQTAIREKQTPDLLFISHSLFLAIQSQLHEISPETKLIVACDRAANSSASVLRKGNIAAIDDNDYLRCAPLNAVIALTVFDKLMSVKS